jgi:endonuclease G
VPKYFYKVLLDVDGPEKKGIGFIIPNERSDGPLESYAVSIDAVEERTGIDFFANLLSLELEEEIESKMDIMKWPVSEARYKRRVSDWNNQ